MSDDKRAVVDGAKIREEAVARGDVLREEAVAHAAGVMGRLQGKAAPTVTPPPTVTSPTVVTPPTVVEDEGVPATTTETAGV